MQFLVQHFQKADNNQFFYSELKLSELNLVGTKSNGYNWIDFCLYFIAGSRDKAKFVEVCQSQTLVHDIYHYKINNKC